MNHARNELKTNIFWQKSQESRSGAQYDENLSKLIKIAYQAHSTKMIPFQHSVKDPEQNESRRCNGVRCGNIINK
jgi:hypothetical protein